MELDGRLYHVNEDVDLGDVVQVVPLEWKGLPKLLSNKRRTLRKSEVLKKSLLEITSSVLDRFSGGVQNARDPDYVMNLSGGGMDHIVHSTIMEDEVHGEVLLAVLQELDALARSSYTIRTHKDTRSSDGQTPRVGEVRQVHRFFVPVEYGRQLYTLKMTVKEFENGKNEIGRLDLYDQSLAKKIPSAPSQNIGSKNLVAGKLELPGAISVRDMIRSVKILWFARCQRGARMFYGKGHPAVEGVGA